MEFALMMYLGVLFACGIIFILLTLYQIWLIIVGAWDDRKDGKRD